MPHTHPSKVDGARNWHFLSPVFGEKGDGFVLVWIDKIKTNLFEILLGMENKMKNWGGGGEQKNERGKRGLYPESCWP